MHPYVIRYRVTYAIDCGDCDFVREYADEVTAYAEAKEHEAAFPEHYVSMDRRV